LGRRKGSTEFGRRKGFTERLSMFFVGDTLGRKMLAPTVILVLDPGDIVGTAAAEALDEMGNAKADGVSTGSFFLFWPLNIGRPFDRKKLDVDFLLLLILSNIDR